MKQANKYSTFILISLILIKSVFSQTTEEKIISKNNCKLVPLNIYKYEFDNCGVTEKQRGLEKILPKDKYEYYGKYKNYGTIENISHNALLIGVIFFGLDWLSTNYLVKSICSPSFNPNCNEKSTSIIPTYYYIGYFSISIPISIFSSLERIKYLKYLVNEYNEEK